MNIVLVNSEHPSASGLDHGGIATYTYCMANALACAGHTVHVVAREGTVPDALREGVIFHTFARQPVSGFQNLFSSVIGNQILFEQGFSKGAHALVMRLHQKQPVDIVEIPEYNGLGYNFRKPRPFPLVVHLHTPTRLVDQFNENPANRQRKRWYRYEESSLARADKVVSPSAGLLDTMKNYMDMPYETAVIRHGMPTEVFDAVRLVSPDTEKIHILFSGRLERRKGAEILRETVRDILAADDRIHITVAGETNLGESHEYRTAIERSLDNHMRSRLWFLGPVDSSRLPALYKQSDIFLFPSLFENAPFALFEAMAAGLPVVACDVSGVNEIVVHNTTGLISSPETPALFTKNVLKLVKNKNLRTEMGEAGKRHLKENFSPRKAVESTVALYTSVIESFSRQ